MFLKIIVIGFIFLSGLACFTGRYDIVKGTDINPDLVSGIGLVLMLVSAAAWSIWGKTARTRVDERTRIKERERARKS